LFYSFPLSKLYISRRLYLELWEKFSPTKILSKQDKLLIDLPSLVKKVIEKNGFKEGG
jgi:hypothetical protein